jgi:hypothetical protein
MSLKEWMHTQSPGLTPRWRRPAMYFLTSARACANDTDLDGLAASSAIWCSQHVIHQGSLAEQYRFVDVI